MLKKFDVSIKADAFYFAVEAETKEEAIEQALEWFLYYEPDIFVTESDEEDCDGCDGCIHSNQFTLDDVASCNCCEDYSYYTPKSRY